MAALSEAEFVRRWLGQPSTTSSQVLAVAEDTGLMPLQVKYVKDWYQHRHRTDRIDLKVLLEECDKYRNGTKVFPPFDGGVPSVQTTSSVAAAPRTTVDVHLTERDRLFVKNLQLAVEREREYLEQARRCTVCKTRKRDITCLPCRHFTMCKTCAGPIYECPTCEKDIRATAETYFT